MPIPGALGIWLDRGASRTTTIRQTRPRRAIFDRIAGMIDEVDA
jgi:hypothetical protein